MISLKDTPIQKKLMSIILLTCSIVLVLLCSVYISFEYSTFREAVKKNISTLGVIIASNSSAALAFDSPRDASEILYALRADKHIVAACIFDNKGTLFAKYPSYAAPEVFPSKPLTAGYHFSETFLEGYQPITQENLKLGTLYIKSDLEAVYDQMLFNVFIAALLIAGSLIIAYILSNILQKTISKPILILEKTARIISDKHDYSVRARKYGDDELGSLTDAFNQMLDQIERQNQEIIHANEESLKLAAIVESSGDAIIGSSLDLIITSWNKSAERIFGYPASAIIGHPVSVIIPAEHQNKVQEIFNRLKNAEQVDSFETVFITNNQQLLDISLTVSPVKNASGIITGISQIARDITRQKQNERSTIENEEHLRLATQAAELGTFDMDLLAGTMSWDNRCRELFGITHHDQVTYENDFLNGLHDDDKERILKVIEGVFNKQLSNGNYDVEYRTVSADKKLRWIRAKGKVFFNENDKPVRFIGTVLDITNKKQEEIRKNDFIAIISHELKTPLTTIKSYVQILLAKAKSEGDSFKINALTRTETQTNKMTSMIQDFLSLARMEEGKLQLTKEDFPLHSLMQDVVFEATFLTPGHRITLTDCEAISIHADKDKLGQVLINLLSNAIKYSPTNSTITIGCEKINDKVKIFVTDEGVGINAADQKNLFTRFYRVDNEKIKTVSGFGIGLYIVSEILRYHNSQIMIQSEEGVGSTFYFLLDAR